MKTVLEELIEMYNRDIIKLKGDFKQTTSIIISREISTLEHVVTNLESRLLKEKEQIMTAFYCGDLSKYEGNPNKYFDDNYKNID